MIIKRLIKKVFGVINFMKNAKLVGILLSAVGCLSIFNNRSNLVNLNKVSEVFDHFYQAPISKIDFTKITYEKDFYKDCITEKLKKGNKDKFGEDDVNVNIFRPSEKLLAEKDSDTNNNNIISKEKLEKLKNTKFLDS